MKKLLLVTTCLIIAVPTFAAEPIISPEELFQKAKEQCPKNRSFRDTIERLHERAHWKVPVKLS
jgi:hypothetical protein